MPAPQPNPWPALARVALFKAFCWASASAALASWWTPAFPLAPPGANLALLIAAAAAALRRGVADASNRADADALLAHPLEPTRNPWAKAFERTRALEWMLALPLMAPLGPAPPAWGSFCAQSCSAAQALAHFWSR
jgi:hypothetical protein